MSNKNFDKDEINKNFLIKNNLNDVSNKMIENTTKLIDEFKLLNGELKELIEMENELKNKVSLNLNKKNDLINLERKLTENNIENNEYEKYFFK